MRLFAAVYPPAEALDDVAGQVARLRIGQAAADGINVRLVARSTLHVTVVFIGDVDDDRLPEVTAALDWAVRDWRTVAGAPAGIVRPGRGPDDPGPAPPRIRLGGGGRFGQESCTVLWVGVRGEVDALVALAAAARSGLERSGLPYDPRPFCPHLTVALPRELVDQATVEADRATLDGYLGSYWPMTELVLMCSQPGPQSSYHRLAAWPL